MGRPLRLVFCNRLVHVMSHTLDNHWFDKNDLRNFKGKIQKLNARHEEFVILYWTIMGNHIHILFAFHEDHNCGIIVGTILKALTDAYNEARHREGSLWRGRYKDVTIYDESHLWAALTYIALNRAKTGVITSPKNDDYSSYKVYAEGSDDGITTVLPDFYDLGDTIEDCQREFKTMMSEALAAWKSKRTWDKVAKGEEVLVGNGRVNMAEILDMFERQERILHKADRLGKAHMSKENKASREKTEARRKARHKRQDVRCKRVEALWARGLPRWILDHFWASDDYIVDFAYAHPDRFGLARAPTY